MFGGNSNWRGPIWLATTFLLIESLQRFYQYYGNSLKVYVASADRRLEPFRADPLAFDYAASARLAAATTCTSRRSQKRSSTA